MGVVLTFFTRMCFDKSSKRARSVCLLFSLQVLSSACLYTSAIVFVSMKNEVSD